MEKIRVASLDFWRGFDLSSSIFGCALKLAYEVEVIDDIRKADLVFESCFPPKATLLNRTVKKLKELRGNTISGKRVFFLGEPYPIPVSIYNGVISYHLHMGENHFRFPLWAVYCDLWKGCSMWQAAEIDEHIQPAQLTTARLTNPTKFACAVFSNKQHLRLKSPQWLKPYGTVDVFGRAMGRPIKSKLETLPDYKFNVCFENTILPGYTTEKALHAKVSGCIPLYWGDPAYRVDFNEKSLINVYEYNCDFERIFETVDMEEVRHTPLINEGNVPYHLLDDLSQFLEGVMRAPASSVF